MWWSGRRCVLLNRQMHAAAPLTYPVLRDKTLASPLFLCTMLRSQYIFDKSIIIQFLSSIR